MYSLRFLQSIYLYNFRYYLNLYYYLGMSEYKLLYFHRLFLL